MSNPFIEEEVVASPEQIKADRLNNLIRELKRDGRRLLDQSIRTVVQNWNNVWENENLTPAEVLVSMGTDAVEIFRISALFTACIYEIDPTFLDAKYLSAGLPYTAHEDGTITLQ